MSKNKIVYLQWGDRYTQEHVDRLYDQINKNCSVDFDFMTVQGCHEGAAFDQMQSLQKKYYRGDLDVDSSITENSSDTYVREDAGGLAHFRKFILFMRDDDDRYFDKDDTILYVDLDTLITNDLSYFFDLDNSKPWIARSWQFNKDSKWKRLYNLRSCPYFNSSVMVWKPGQCRKIFNQLTNPVKIEAAFFQYGAIDNWLFHRFGPMAYSKDDRNFFNHFDKDIVVSDPSYMTNNTKIHTLAGLSMNEKNKICLN